MADGVTYPSPRQPTVYVIPPSDRGLLDATGLLLLGLFLLAVDAFAVAEAVIHRAQPVGNPSTLILPLLVAAMAGVSIWMSQFSSLAGAPESVSVSGEGVAFGRRRGRVKAIPWTSPAIRVDIWDLLAVWPESRVPYPTHHYFLIPPRMGKFRIPESVCLRVVEEAERHRLRITTSTDDTRPVTRITTIRIRPRESGSRDATGR